MSADPSGCKDKNSKKSLKKSPRGGLPPTKMATRGEEDFFYLFSFCVIIIIIITNALKLSFKVS